MPKISVILTSYNARPYLEKAMESIYEQEGDFELRVIAIDDCSSDGSYEFLKDLSKRYSFSLYQTPQNSGPSSARNLGLSYARGEYICFLDGDDYFLSGKITAQLQAFKENPDAALVYTNSLMVKSGVVLDFLWSDYYPHPSGHVLQELCSRNFINLCSVMVRRKYIEEISFDETIRQAEDYKFWIQLAMLNDNFIYLDEPYVAYRRTGSTLTKQRINAISANLKVIDEFLGKINAPADKLFSEQKLALHMEAARLATRKKDFRLHIASILEISPKFKKMHLVRILIPAFPISKLVFDLFFSPYLSLESRRQRAITY